MTRVWDVPVHDTTRVRDVRVAAESACSHAGLNPRRTAAAALVATELATNLLKHAGGGDMVINLVRQPDAAEATEMWVQIVSLDHGPGIGDVEEALSDGFTTLPSSLGAGLGTCLRLANGFDLYSRRGHGTVAVARVGAAPAVHHAALRGRRTGERAGGINVSLALAEHSGDAFAWVRSGSRLTLMLADGLGHGAKAAHASTTAVDQLRRTADLPPDDILRGLDMALRPTRGAAISLGQLDEARGVLTFSGVGNVGARFRCGDSWQPLVSHPGIVGAHFPARPPVHQVPWQPDSLFILHSDGLPGRWTPPTDPRLLAHDPAVIAAAVLRDAGSAARPLRDDTSVAVLVPDRWTDLHGST